MVMASLEILAVGVARVSVLLVEDGAYVMHDAMGAFVGVVAHFLELFVGLAID